MLAPQHQDLIDRIVDEMHRARRLLFIQQFPLL